MPKVAKPPAKPQTQMRDYTVVRVQQDGSQVVADKGVPARRQEEACDLVVARLPEGERNGKFAAYLSGSYREFEYVSEQTWVTTKKKPTVATNGAAPTLDTQEKS